MNKPNWFGDDAHMSWQEIGAELNLNPKHVQAICNKALKKVMMHPRANEIKDLLKGIDMGRNVCNKHTDLEIILKELS